MRTLLALLILVAWLAVTVLTGVPVPETSTIAAVVTEGFARQLAFASAFLVLMALLLRWPDLGFARPRPESLRVLWLPALYVAGFIGAGLFFGGMPPAGVLLLLLVNASLGSFSEEVMYRGFLYAGLRDALPIWPAILLTSLLFGAPHVLNVFLIGHLQAAIFQAIFASFIGIMFLSVRIRTGSLWPVIVLHAFWNTGLVLISREAPPLDPNQPIPAIALVLTLLGMLPILAYPFWLLRGIGRRGDGGAAGPVPPPPDGRPAGTRTAAARSASFGARETDMADASSIREHMEVIGADGVRVGVVDAVEGDRLKLTRRDSGQGHHEGHHHFLPLALVADIEGDRVRLSATGAVAAELFEEEEGGEAAS